MVRSIYLSILFILFSKLAIAQEANVETQYFINKWIYNPAQFDTEETILSLSYKNQWVGLDGAPNYGSLGIQNYQVGSGYFGFLFKQLTDGPFNEYEAMASYGYQAKFSDKTKLNLGLSLGYGIQTTDFTQLSDPGDPGLQNFADNNGYFQGNFGVSLDYGNASIGASVPRLFDQFVAESQLVSATTPEVFFFSGSYMIHTTREFSFEPQLLFHMNNNIEDQQLEVMGSVYYDHKVWLGGSFRESYGVSAFAGALFHKFDFSYIYTLPSVASEINQPSHELILRYRLRKNRNTTRTTRAEAYNDPYDINDYLNSSEEDTKAEEDTQTEHEAASDVLVTDVDNDESFILKPGYYIVLGQFYLKSSTLKFRNDLTSKGVEGKVIYLHDAGLYYMYADYFENGEAAKLRLEETKTQSITTDPWIYEVK